MTPPIPLSLAGDGRLVCLTPQTVRPYYQFIAVNSAYARSERYRLEVPLQGRPDRTILDGLQSAPHVYLYAKDIRIIEREINRQIVENGLGLFDGEGVLLQGYGVCRKVGQNREKINYIIRHGLIFILAPTNASKAITTKNVDIFWQDQGFDFHYVRYYGLRSSLQSKRVELVFRDRLNLSKSWTFTREEFRPRQVLAIYPCEGFSLQL